MEAERGKKSGTGREPLLSEALALTPPAVADTPPEGRVAPRRRRAFGPASMFYCLLFTPRAGSTWLVDLLSRQRVLGVPREYLNHNLAPRIASLFGATTVDDYLAALHRERVTRNGVFGMKATYFQIRHAELDLPFDRLFPEPRRWLYIRRRNIVAQGISLWKAVSSRVPHRHANLSAEDLQTLTRLDTELAYDAAAIEHWIEHVLQQEIGMEKLVAEHTLQPLRLVYEDVRAAGELATLDQVHRAVLDTPFPSNAFVSSVIGKMGGAQSGALEQRFRGDQSRVLAEFEARRPELPPVS